MTDYCTLYVICASREEATLICGSLVSEKLVACGNIIDGVTSIYELQGEVCEDTEAILFLKTRKSDAKKATDRIKSIHSYEIPCICQWNIDDGNEEYLEWLNKVI